MVYHKINGLDEMQVAPFRLCHLESQLGGSRGEVSMTTNLANSQPTEATLRCALSRFLEGTVGNPRDFVTGCYHVVFVVVEMLLMLQ